MDVTPDVIVFTQGELEAALKENVKCVALCDNEFFLAEIPSETIFIGIGTVVLSAASKPENIYNLEFRKTAVKNSYDTVGSSVKSQGICSSYRLGRTTSYIGGSYNRRYISSYRYSSSYMRSSYRTGSYTVRKSHGGSYRSSRPLSSYRKTSYKRLRHFEGPYSEGLDELFDELDRMDLGGYGIHLI